MKTIKFIVYKASLTDVANGLGLIENEEVIGIIVKEFSQQPGRPYYGAPIGGYPRHNPNIPGGVPQYNPNLPYTRTDPNLPAGTPQYYNPNVAGGVSPNPDPRNPSGVNPNYIDPRNPGGVDPNNPQYPNPPYTRNDPNVPAGNPQYYNPNVPGGIAPYYDPRNPAAFDPNNPQYNQIDPNSPQYNAAIDPNNPNYDPNYKGTHQPTEVDIRLFIDGFPLIKCVSQGNYNGQYQIVEAFSGSHFSGERRERHSKKDIVTVDEKIATEKSLENANTDLPLPVEPETPVTSSRRHK